MANDKLNEIQIGEVVYDLQDKEAAKIYVGIEEPPKDPSILWIDPSDEGGDILAAVAISGNYNDLSNKPTIITMEQVNAAIQTAISQIAIYNGSVS